MVASTGCLFPYIFRVPLFSQPLNLPKVSPPPPLPTTYQHFPRVSSSVRAHTFLQVSSSSHPKVPKKFPSSISPIFVSLPEHTHSFASNLHSFFVAFHSNSFSPSPLTCAAHHHRRLLLHLLHIQLLLIPPHHRRRSVGVCFNQSTRPLQPTAHHQQSPPPLFLLLNLPEQSCSSNTAAAAEYNSPLFLSHFVRTASSPSSPIALLCVL